MNCSSLCLCKDCTNKYAKRPPPSKARNRAKYDNQKFPLCGCLGSTFLNDIGESVKVGPLTLLEILVFKTITKHFILNGIELSQTHMTFAYQRICELARSDEIEYPLFDRKSSEIKKFWSKLLNSLELFKSLIC